MEIVLYDNNLNIENFIHMLDDPSECYKFYWLDSILNLLVEGKDTFYFDDVINGMIADAWYSVCEYHLHLGPKDTNGDTKNGLERAINKLSSMIQIKADATKNEVIEKIKLYENSLNTEKDQISKNVPYRLLSSFMPEIGGSDKIWSSTKRLIAYIDKLDQRTCLPYTIGDAVGYKNKTIKINSYWKKMLLDNLVMIKGWIQIKKIKYLQNRNPGVPGIIYKLEPENEKQRKLGYVRKLWDAVINVTNVYDIYSGKIIYESDYEIDHFIPWSYVTNDEIWNLMPMESSLNSSKSNKLPKWKEFFRSFADNQYLMYQCVYENDVLMKKFDQCRRDNIISLWASEELYNRGNTKLQFTNILEKNLKSVYDCAKIQGYTIWNFSCDKLERI